MMNSIMISKVIVMSSFVYTLLGLAVGSTLHCSVRQQISPCTCSYSVLSGPHTIDVACEKMDSFEEVKRALKGQFAPASKLKLRITHSNLQDLYENGSSGFGDLNLFVTNLNISQNNITSLRGEAFSSMGNVTLLNVEKNLLTEVPVTTLAHMPRLRSLTLAENRLTVLHDYELKDVKHLNVLVMTENRMTELGRHSMPRGLEKLAIQRNHLTNLNDSVKDLHGLEWLWVNQNHLVSLDGQLPTNGKLTILNASHNALQSLPFELRAQPLLENLFVDHNELRSLGGALQKCRKLTLLGATYNHITSLSEEEFLETESLHELMLGHNKLAELNGALRPLRQLCRLSLHHNLLTDFSLAEVRGLRELKELDLRHNRIQRLISSAEMQNVVEVDTPQVVELRLGHNELSTLDGFLRGLPGLRTLDLSHNRLRNLPPDELMGLDNLRLLDISHNQLTSLADTAKKILPALETLLAGHNLLASLERDLHGLPALCVADLSYNKITRVGAEVAEGSACKVRSVPATLRIFLQGNLLHCDAELSVAQEETENSHAELVGVPECEEYISPEPAATLPPPQISLPAILVVLKNAATEEPQEFAGALPQLQPEISNMALQPAPLLAVDEATYSDGSIESAVPAAPAVKEPIVDYTLIDIDPPTQQPSSSEEVIIDLSDLIYEVTTQTPPAE